MHAENQDAPGMEKLLEERSASRISAQLPFIIKRLSRGVAIHPRQFLTLVSFKLTSFFILTDNKLNAGNLLFLFCLILNCSLYYYCSGLKAHRIVLLWSVLLLGLCHTQRIIPVSDSFFFFLFLLTPLPFIWLSSSTYFHILSGNFSTYNNLWKNKFYICSKLDQNIVLYTRLNFFKFKFYFTIIVCINIILY